jgi:hypothetical protein
MRRALALGAALALAGVPVAEARSPLLRSVSKSVKLKDGLKKASVKCPRGYAALHGAPTRPPLDAVATRSVPGKRARSWAFSIAADSSAKLRVVVRCGRHVRWSTRSRKNVKVAADTTRLVKLRCPKGRAAVGYGYRQGLTLDTPQVPPTIDLYRARLSGRIASLGLRNDTTEDGRITLYAQCLKRPKGTRLRGKVFRDRVASGESDKKHRCPRRTQVLSPGFDFDPADGVSANAAYPSGKNGGRWRFESSLLDQASANTYLLCLRG